MRQTIVIILFFFFASCGGEDDITQTPESDTPDPMVAICQTQDLAIRPTLVEDIRGVSAAIPEGKVVSLSFTGGLIACGLPVAFTGFRFGERVMGEKFPVLTVINVLAWEGCDECVIRSFIKDWMTHGEYQSYKFDLELAPLEPHQAVQITIYAGYFGKSYRGRAIFDLTPLCDNCDVVNKNGGSPTIMAIATVL